MVIICYTNMTNPKVSSRFEPPAHNVSTVLRGVLYSSAWGDIGRSQGVNVLVSNKKCANNVTKFTF